jgi:predicted porin
MKKKLLASALVAMVSAGTHAEVNFSGFASLAAGKAFGESETVDGFESDTISFKNNSFVALQGTSDIGDGLGATVQVLSRGSQDWEPDVTWAFLSYDVSDEWRIIGGRQRMPHYTYSDYIEVSYAYNWVTVPEELYNAPFDSFDGISSSYTMNFDNSTLTVQVLAGEEDGLDVEVRGTEEVYKSYADIIGGKLTYNYDWLTLTLGYFEFEETSTIDDEIDAQGNLVSYDVGVQVDYNDWLVSAEVTTVDLSDLHDYETGVVTGLGEIQPWMVSVGKRFGDITPHATYGKYRSLDFFGSDTESDFYTVGVRWDFNPSAALKAEYSSSEDARFGDGESFQIAIVTVF